MRENGDKQWMKRLLCKNHVWDLVEPPLDRQVIGSIWVFKKKTDCIRLVETQTFSPVIRFESLRTLMAVQNDIVLHQMDVTTASLNGILTEEVYMTQPEEFTENGKEYFVCKLKQSIIDFKNI